MKKCLAFVLVLIFLPLSSLAEPFSFRNGIVFGMSADEIIAIEGAKPDVADDTYLFYYDQKAAGLDCDISYSLQEGKLNRIGIIFSEKHSNDNLYIDDFISVRKSLTYKYGNPTVEELFDWNNDLFKDNPDDYGIALAMGHLSIFNGWELEDVQIINVLSGDNYEVTHHLIYSVVGYTSEPNTDGI